MDQDQWDRTGSGDQGVKNDEDSWSRLLRPTHLQWTRRGAFLGCLFPSAEFLAGSFCLRARITETKSPGSAGSSSAFQPWYWNWCTVRESFL